MVGLVFWEDGLMWRMNRRGGMEANLQVRAAEIWGEDCAVGWGAVGCM